MFWKQVKIALVFQFNIYLKTLLEYAQLIHEVQRQFVKFPESLTGIRR